VTPTGVDDANELQASVSVSADALLGGRSWGNMCQSAPGLIM